MGKNNNRQNSGNRNGRHGGGSFSDIFSGDVLANTDLNAPKLEEKKADENPYKGYVPPKGKNNSRGGYSQGGGNKQRNGNQNGRRGNNGNGGKVEKVRDLDKAPHAPYNFVQLYDHVMEAPGDVNNGAISDKLHSGSIRYSFKAKTPILVDSGKDEFYKNKDGKYAIPGSTMRGLIRNNVQILSFSSICGDVDDYSLMYRAVASGYEKDNYQKILGQTSDSVQDIQMSQLKNVRAGYICCDGGQYYIYGTVADHDGTFEKGMPNYYAVSERYVLRDEETKKNFRDILGKLQHDKNTKFDFSKDYRGKTHYRGNSNRGYKPYYQKITYSVSEQAVDVGKIDTFATSVNSPKRTVVDGIAAQGLEHKGYVTSTGKMQEKKAFYVIPEMNEDKTSRIPIPEESVTAFRVDYNRKKNIVKDYRVIPQAGDPYCFFDLPPEGEVRPVFYIKLREKGGKLYFGYTPHLRLMYDHTIQEGLHQQELGEGKRDFAQMMFGFSDKEDSRKSRVFFTDATLKKEVTSEKERKLVLAEPKPTSYLEYLNQKEGDPAATYNSDAFELRGIKQYWLHKNVTGGMASNNEKVGSKINPLPAGSEFAGKIRFRNLSSEELGLLIWSICLNPESQMNVGKAKPYGYGRIKVDSVELSLFDPKAAYGSDSAFGRMLYSVQTEEQKDAFVDNYKRMLAGWIQNKPADALPANDVEEIIKNRPTLQAFFDMKSYLGEGRTVEYMGLEQHSDDGFSKHKNENHPLPTVFEIYNEKNQGKNS